MISPYSVAVVIEYEMWLITYCSKIVWKVVVNVFVFHFGYWCNFNPVPIMSLSLWLFHYFRSFMSHRKVNKLCRSFWQLKIILLAVRV